MDSDFALRDEIHSSIIFTKRCNNGDDDNDKDGNSTHCGDDKLYSFN